MHRLTLFLERILPISILVMAAVGVPVLMLAPEGVPRLRSLSRELAQVEAENADLRQQIQHLRGRVQHLREDPVAVERIARDELGLVRSSEVVFQFPRR
jgi:cell division protein FtsB